MDEAGNISTATAPANGGTLITGRYTRDCRHRMSGYNTESHGCSRAGKGEIVLAIAEHFQYVFELSVSKLP
jgi:hypothetical protein